MSSFPTPPPSLRACASSARLEMHYISSPRPRASLLGVPPSVTRDLGSRDGSIGLKVTVVPMQRSKSGAYLAVPEAPRRVSVLHSQALVL